MTAAACAPPALLDLINAAWTTQAVAAACELGLPDRLALGARATPGLAIEIGCDVDALRRMLRALVALQVCREDGEDTFALGPLGPWLCEGAAGGLRHWALLNGGPLWTRWSTLADRVRSGNPTGPHRTEQRFGHLAHDARESRLFHGAMVELSARVAGSLAAALPPLGDALVVDVGGGAGEVLATVLARHPAARGLLFDLPEALAHADEPLHRHGVRARCTLQAGSFFDAVPGGGDLYLLKSVLHDWDDERALAVLRRCRQALQPGARLMIVERLRPVRPGSTPADRAIARADLNMLVALAGCERDEPSFQALLDDAGLALSERVALDAGFSALIVGAC